MEASHLPIDSTFATVASVERFVMRQLQLMPDRHLSSDRKYDNVSDTVGYNSRVVWEFRPGARVFLVLNQGYDRRHSTVRLEQSNVTVKLSASLRF